MQRDHHAKWLQDRSAWVSDMLGLEQTDTKGRGETRVKVSGVPPSPEGYGAAGGCQVSGEGEFTIEHSAHRIRPTTAEVLGTFVDGEYAGEAAATVNAFGEGKTFFMVCVSQPLGAWLMAQAVTAAGIASHDNDCDMLTIVPHLGGSGHWCLNYSDTPQTVDGVVVPAHDFVFVPGEAPC